MGFEINGILIMIALVLGYSQGIKRKRQKEGKVGGIFKRLGNRFTRKGRKIEEQEQEIFDLKEEVLTLKNKNDYSSDIFLKGSKEDFHKELFFHLWKDEDKKENAIETYMFIFYANEIFNGISDELFTLYSWQQLLKQFMEEVLPTKTVIHQVKDIEYVFPVEALVISSTKFMEDFGKYKFIITFKELERVFREVIEA